MLAGMIPEYKRNCVHARTSARVYISMRLIDNHSALWRLLILNFTHLELDKHSCRALSLITQIQEKVFGSSLPMTLFSPFLFLSCSLCVWVCVSFSLWWYSAELLISLTSGVPRFGHITEYMRDDLHWLSVQKVQSVTPIGSTERVLSNAPAHLLELFI